MIIKKPRATCKRPLNWPLSPTERWALGMAVFFLALTLLAILGIMLATDFAEAVLSIILGCICGIFFLVFCILFFKWRFFSKW